MIQLLQELKVPKKFEKADNAFWKDPYISAQLLKSEKTEDVSGEKYEGKSNTIAFLLEKM